MEWALLLFFMQAKITACIHTYIKIFITFAMNSNGGARVYL